MFEWLRDILGDGYSEDIDRKVSAAIGKAFVSRSDFNAVKRNLSAAKQEIADRDAEIAGLHAAVREAAVLRQTVTELHTQLDRISRTAAVQEQLTALGVTDPEYVIYKIGGIEKFSFDKDGRPEKMEDLIAPLKKTAPHLFTSTAQMYPSAGGATVSAAQTGRYRVTGLYLLAASVTLLVSSVAQLHARKHSMCA